MDNDYKLGDETEEIQERTKEEVNFVLQEPQEEERTTSSTEPMQETIKENKKSANLKQESHI